MLWFTPIRHRAWAGRSSSPYVPPTPCSNSRHSDAHDFFFFVVFWSGGGWVWGGFLFVFFLVVGFFLFFCVPHLRIPNFSPQRSTSSVWFLTDPAVWPSYSNPEKHDFPPYPSEAAGFFFFFGVSVVRSSLTHSSISFAACRFFFA